MLTRQYGYPAVRSVGVIRIGSRRLQAKKKQLLLPAPAVNFNGRVYLLAHVLTHLESLSTQIEKNTLLIDSRKGFEAGLLFSTK